MQEWVSTLLDLQTLDVKAAKIEELLASIPRQEAEVKQIYQAESEAVEAAKKNVQDCLLKIKEIEREIAAVKSQKEAFLSKSAMIKNNDEYRAAMLQIELCGKRISELEDEQLITMDEMEKAQALLKTKNDSLTEARHRADGVVGDLETRRTNLTASLNELKEQRVPLAAAIDPKLLAKYDRLRNSRQNVKTRDCVVSITDGVCGRCRMMVTPQMQVQASRGELMVCGSCGALLYSLD